MKKYIIFLIICIISNIFQNVSANNDKNIIKKVNQKLQTQIKKGGPEVKLKYENLLKRYIKIFEKNPQKQKIFEKILKNILISDFSKYFQKHTQEFHINHEEIKNYWLDLHNQKRKNYGAKPYIYNQKLQNTAIEWSFNNFYKQQMDHKRNFSDGWYDYHTVKHWFQERGVNCKISGRYTESESIAHYGFYCTDGNCNDEFKESLKEIFDIYYAEKGLQYPADAHYRAIIAKQLQEIGLGYTLYQSDIKNYYEYYLATHYCTQVK